MKRGITTITTKAAIKVDAVEQITKNNKLDDYGYNDDVIMTMLAAITRKSNMRRVTQEQKELFLRKRKVGACAQYKERDRDR